MATTPKLDESLSGFVDQLTTTMTFISDKIVKAAPDVSHLLLKATQLSAAVEIGSGVIGIGIGAFVLSKLTPKFIRIAREADSYDCMEIVGALSAVATAIIGGMFLLGGVLAVFDPHNIIALFSPESAIALKAMALVAKGH